MNKAAHLAARVTNILEAIETFFEVSEPSQRRDSALLELLRAANEDADELATLLNSTC
jgi:hypothetical protein